MIGLERAGFTAARSLPPVADTARPARPDLNPRIHGLRVQRIAAPVREATVRCAFWRFSARRCCRLSVRGRNLGRNRGLSGHDVRIVFAAAILHRLHRNRHKFRRWAEQLRRQHRFRQVEPEKLFSPIFGRR